MMGDIVVVTIYYYIAVPKRGLGYKSGQKELPSGLGREIE